MSAPLPFDIYSCGLDGINLIEASAGTGKTWSICGLYLRLLLERDYAVQQILVVTFTNAATAELRDRIRSRIVETLDYLDGIAAPGDPFVPELVATLERNGHSRETLARKLDLAAQTFDEASIFTIHGFCQRALADTAFAAGLPLSFELVEDDADLRLEAVRDFWRRHVAADGLDADLAAHLVAKKDAPEKWAALLKRHLAKPLAACRWPEGIDAPAATDRAALAAAYDTAATTWHAERKTVIELLIAALPSLNANSYKEDGVRQGATEWDAWFADGDALAPVDDKGKQRLFRKSILVLRTKNKKTTPAHPFFDQAEELLALRDALMHELAMGRLGLVRDMLAEGGRDVRARKREDRVVAFDDMLWNLHRALAGGASPWLADSLRQRFPVALIDEFQDTDPLQFAIFDAVYGAGTQPLFLVGDPKQAIYSFRNADLYTYLAAKGRAAATWPLAHNQRSTPGLIQAVNGLFCANPAAFMLPGLDYASVSAGDRPRQPLRDHSAARADFAVWMLPAGDDGPLLLGDARAAVLRATAAEIARLVSAAEGGRIHIGERPLATGDIAVLVRTHAQGAAMKQALAALGIGSIELSRSSVYHTSDAEELERILAALLEPARDGLLRAALATEFIGLDAGGIDAAGEAQQSDWLQRFGDYRALWLRSGIGLTLRRLMADTGVAARMLARADGERRLTNLLHLGEALHRAAQTHRAPDALLHWLQARRSEDSAGDEAQLRLESDRNLVQIVTIHKAKGLEYPVVFCPFLWDARRSPDGRLEGREYHDAARQAVIDFRDEGDEGNDGAAIKAQIALEGAAEFLRLAYVALTRAVHRCYLVAGCYTSVSFGNPSTTRSTRSTLNWLVAGAGMSPADWFNAKKAPAEIDAAWHALATSHPESIDVQPIPMQPGMPFVATHPAAETLHVAAPPPRRHEAWRIGSYSGLSYGATSETSALDHDARADSAASPADEGEDIDADDIVNFPRGAEAGQCLHEVFERIDFSDAAGWPDAIRAALERYPALAAQLPDRDARPRMARMLAAMLRDVLATALPHGIRLRDIPPPRRLVELEFSLPAPRLGAASLNAALHRLGYAGPRLNFAMLSGYLKGYMDLVFEHAGRYYLLDWKSNHLGFRRHDYQGASLAAAMAGHGYHLQYLLYTVALHRYLGRRIADYRYDRHFGGVLYLFVRGVRPDWTSADGSAGGVYGHRPAHAAVLELEALLCAPPTQAAS
jgi:exodeoxyribonuclease V beta subunit